MQEKFKLKSFQDKIKFVLYKNGFKTLVPEATEEEVEQMAITCILEDVADEEED